MKLSGMIFGLIIVVIGAALLFDNIDVSGDYPIGDYWPVILIALGLFGWIGSGLRPEFGNLVLMTLGGILLTQNLSDDYSFRDLWPALVIAIGVAIITSPLRRGKRRKAFKMRFDGGHGHRWHHRGRGQHHSSSHDINEMFSEAERVVEGEYTGSSARLKMSGGSIDFTNAVLPEEGAVLDLDIVLAGYKIRVPESWIVDVDADVTMGEISDNRSNRGGDSEMGPTLTIVGKVFMAGVEITN